MRVSWSYTWRIHYVGKSPRERVISSVRIIKNARAPNNSCPLYTVILRTNTPFLIFLFTNTVAILVMVDDLWTLALQFRGFSNNLKDQAISLCFSYAIYPETNALSIKAIE